MAATTTNRGANVTYEELYRKAPAHIRKALSIAHGQGHQEGYNEGYWWFYQTLLEKLQSRETKAALEEWARHKLEKNPPPPEFDGNR